MFTSTQRLLLSFSVAAGSKFPIFYNMQHLCAMRGNTAASECLPLCGVMGREEEIKTGFFFFLHQPSVDDWLHRTSVNNTRSSCD